MNGNLHDTTPSLRTGLTVVAVLALVAVTGCVGGGNADVGADITPDTEPAETNMTGDEILGTALDTAEDVETYRFESETRMDLASFFGVSISMNTTGEFDRNESLAHARTEGEGGAELFFLSGGEYFETEVYQSSGRWYTRTLNETTSGNWETTDAERPLSPGLKDLSTTVREAEPRLEGVAEVNGTEAYVLSLNVSAESLGEAFSRTMEDHGSGQFDDGEDGGNASEGDIETSEAYLWVEKETYSPLRFAYIVSLSFEGDGENEASGEMEILGDTRYTGYGDDVEIEVPEAVGD